jgi:2-isopropylmalate synthase
MLAISVYDTTLRDGAQMAGVTFSRQDKLEIIKKLVQELTIPYVELYPHSNPKDRELINEIQHSHPDLLPHLSAFGSTRKADKKPEDDENLNSIISSGCKYATIFGKTWDFHLQFIHATPEENLKMIEDSVAYLKKNGLIVFFDAEHFFDGYKANPEYAINALNAAEKGGAEALILCDTNGGTLPHEIYDIVEVIIKKTTKPLGIHMHNDCGMADAGSIAAVQACLNHDRACQVQGTMNGLGERAGNANLTTILPILAIKMKLQIIPRQKLRNITSVSTLIYELANMVPPPNQPFVGYNAFSHKGGMHIAAVEKDIHSYEQIDPELVGNKRRVLISEMSGKAALLHKCNKFGIEIDKNDPRLVKILEVLKRKESHGYNYEGADASLTILIKGILQNQELAATYYRRYYFEVDYFRVITDVRNLFHEDSLAIYTDANIKTFINADKGMREFHTAADGNGPVNALDKALRKGLAHFYPVLEEIELIDFKVRIANAESGEEGTASRVRVLSMTRDRDGEIWGTIGAHVNIIVAAFVSLLDSYVYKLMKANVKPLHISDNTCENGI